MPLEENPPKSSSTIAPSSSCDSQISNISGSLSVGSHPGNVLQHPQKEEDDMTLPLGLRMRKYNKDIRYHKSKNNGHHAKYSYSQVNEMRKVLKKKGMQNLKHCELQPIWVRMGMGRTYPRKSSVVRNVAEMKQFALLTLEYVNCTSDYADIWVSSS